MSDKRDDGGRYREAHESAEARASRARDLTQTHEGRFTHERAAGPRRMPLAVTQFSAPLFKDKRVNRDGYHPKVTK